MDGGATYLGEEASAVIVKHFMEQGYIDANGKVQEKLKTALKDNTLDVPAEFEASKQDIVAVSKKVSGNLNIKNSDNRRKVELNKQVFLSQDFKELWDKIKYKTTYAVDFDSEKLIEKCCDEIMTTLSVSASKLIYTKAGLAIDKGGVSTEEIDRTAVAVANVRENIPDIIAYLQNETNLTRKTIVEILLRSKSINLFKKNPQKYMEQMAQIISSQMRLMIVDGIKYTKIGDDEFYAQELFENEELTGYLGKNMIESEKSVYHYVVYESGNEENFAEKFEGNKRIKLYAKLPDWFKIATPLGSYNPDCAVLVETDGANKLYFVLETKGNISFDALRPTESAKIQCGHRHFEALGYDVAFEEKDDFNKFIENIGA